MNLTNGELMKQSGITYGRMYDQNAGQFISPDPFIQEPGNPLNYNRYSYVLNNPLKYTDPSGYQKYYPCNMYNSKGGGGLFSYQSKLDFRNIGPTFDEYMNNSGNTWVENEYGIGIWASSEELKSNFKSIGQAELYLMGITKMYGSEEYNRQMVQFAGFENNLFHYSPSTGNFFIPHTSVLVSAPSQGGNTVQTIAMTSNIADITVDVAEQTLQDTRIGAYFAYAISGNNKLVNVVSNTFKYAPYVGLFVTVGTGSYLSTENNPATGRPYQPWAETYTDIGVNIATMYIGAKFGGWYGAGAAAFYIGVKSIVNYQMNNGINPGMMFIINKE